MVLLTLCAVLVVMTLAETGALIQWSRRAELTIPAVVAAGFTQGAAYSLVATRS